jgi:hypothetical protein
MAMWAQDEYFRSTTVLAGAKQSDREMAEFIFPDSVQRLVTTFQPQTKTSEA